MSKALLKKRLLELLKEDEEFRLMVAGLLGYEELLQKMKETLQELAKLRQDMLEGFRRHDEEMARIWGEIAKLREDMIAGFRRHDEELAKLWSEVSKLRQDMLEGFKRHDEEFAKVWAELAKLREDMLEGFRRHDEELAKLRQDMLEGFKRHDEELAKLWSEVSKLREDFNRGFAALNRRLDALGARWGVMAESAFREGLRALLEDLGIRVEKWSAFDEEGRVYGYESVVELDVAVKDGELILVEVASHVKQSDVSTFKRKAEFYAEKTGRKPDKLIIVSPYVDESALRAAKQLGIEVYTSI
ncbi:MAG: DUF3782 domain-containing protein [Thermofilaceae archaeon]